MVVELRTRTYNVDVGCVAFMFKIRCNDGEQLMSVTN